MAGALAHPAPSAAHPPTVRAVNGPTWLAADEVAALLDRDPAAVYRLAHRRNWRLYTHHGRVHYHPDDVGQAFAKYVARLT